MYTGRIASFVLLWRPKSKYEKKLGAVTRLMVRFIGVSALCTARANFVVEHSYCIHTASIATYNPCRDADDPAEWKTPLMVLGPIKSEYLINLVAVGNAICNSCWRSCGAALTHAAIIRQF